MDSFSLSYFLLGNSCPPGRHDFVVLLINMRCTTYYGTMNDGGKQDGGSKITASDSVATNLPLSEKLLPTELHVYLVTTCITVK
jgi:hypothetical protein